MKYLLYIIPAKTLARALLLKKGRVDSMMVLNDMANEIAENYWRKRREIK